MRLLIAIAAAGMAFAQVFEAVSIQPAMPDTPRNRVQPDGPGRMLFENMTLRELATWAYAPARVTGGPPWVDRTRFDVQGKAHGVASQEEFRAMMRALLADRFALKVRTEPHGIVIESAASPPGI